MCQCSFEHAHPDLADEHFLRAHGHSSQAVDTNTANSDFSVSRCPTPAKRQPGSNKRPWKPALTPAEQNLPRDKDAGKLPRTAKRKARVARKVDIEAPHQALQVGENGNDTRAFAQLESKINILQQNVQVQNVLCTAPASWNTNNRNR